jgi:hypothetical protein
VAVEAVTIHERQRLFHRRYREPERGPDHLLGEYLLAEQDRAEVRLLHRTEGGHWEGEDFGAGDLIRLRPLGITIPMQTIYEDVWR